MDLTETTRLAAAINALRPDWPQASLVTFITRDLGARPLRDAAVALVWVACDPDSKTPKRVNERGPWWDAVATGTGRVNTPDTSTLEGSCRKCGLWVVRGEQHECASRAEPEAVAEIRGRIKRETADARRRTTTEKETQP